MRSYYVQYKIIYSYIKKHKILVLFLSKFFKVNNKFFLIKVFARFVAILAKFKLHVLEVIEKSVLLLIMPFSFNKKRKKAKAFTLKKAVCNVFSKILKYVVKVNRGNKPLEYRLADEFIKIYNKESILYKNHILYLKSINTV